MNKRVLLAGLLGGLAYFIWMNLSWVLLPMHTATINTLPGGEAVVEQLRHLPLEDGIYVYPGPDQMMEQPETYRRYYEEGGFVAFLNYRKSPAAPMSPATFLLFFLYSGLAATIAAFLLQLALGQTTGFGSRVLVVTLLGSFSALVGPLTEMLWWHLPAGHSFAVVLDHVLGWTLAGLVIAWRVRPVD